MSRITGPVCRICRRERMKLYLKGEKCFTPKCPVTKRTYPPGLRGPESGTKMTEYGKQLREKQKAKHIYGLNEQQFQLYYERATKEPVTGDALLRFLEMRLDNLIYRAGFATSRPQARQLVGHGWVLVNGQRITIPSQKLKVGDAFEIAQKYQKTPIALSVGERKYTPPRWLQVDPKLWKASVTSLPEKDDFPQDIDATMIVEFYSK